MLRLFIFIDLMKFYYNAWDVLVDENNIFVEDNAQHKALKDESFGLLRF